MNKCIFMGRLTRNPEFRYANSSQPIAVATYTLAIDRKFKKEGEPSVDFLNFVAFGKLADFAEKYLTKGTKIFVTARCQTRNYTNKEGQKVYVTEFVVEEQEFAESKAAADRNEPIPTPTDHDGFMNIPDGIDDELPFN